MPVNRHQIACGIACGIAGDRQPRSRGAAGDAAHVAETSLTSIRWQPGSHIGLDASRSSFASAAVLDESHDSDGGSNSSGAMSEPHSAGIGSSLHQDGLPVKSGSRSEVFSSGAPGANLSTASTGDIKERVRKACSDGEAILHLVLSISCDSNHIEFAQTTDKQATLLTNCQSHGPTKSWQPSRALQAD